MPGSEKKRSQNALSPTSRNSISDRPASLKPWTRRWTKIPGKKPNDSERFRVVDRKLPLNGVTVLGPGGRRLPENSGRRSEEHTSELQSHSDLVCRLLLEKKKYVASCL